MRIELFEILYRCVREIQFRSRTCISGYSPRHTLQGEIIANYMDLFDESGQKQPLAQQLPLLVEVKVSSALNNQD